MPDNELFPYQQTGAAWLPAGGRVKLLADEPGLGKTAQVVTAWEATGKRGAIVVCPSVARYNWAREFEMWSGYVPQVLVNLKDRAANRVVICSYDYARENAAELKLLRPGLLVLDEAHYLKGLETARTKAILGADGLVHAAERCWALSGTPMPNNPSELWPLFRVAGATILSFDKWCEKFCVGYHTAYGYKITGARKTALDELHTLIRDSGIMLRRTKQEVAMQLPPIYFEEVTVEPCLVDEDVCWPDYSMRHKLPELHEKIKAERTMLETVVNTTGWKSRDGLAALSALSASVSTLRRYTGIQKVDGVVELLRGELEAKALNKVVVFAIHMHVIDGIREGLRNFGAVTIYGGTPPQKRQRHIDNFMKRKDCRVLVCNIHAAGTAINLTSAHEVVFAEQAWVPGDNAQAAMRCHRIGQTMPVRVRVVSLVDSIDQAVQRTLMRKARNIAAVIDGERQSDFDQIPETELTLEDMLS